MADPKTIPVVVPVDIVGIIDDVTQLLENSTTAKITSDPKSSISEPNLEDYKCGHCGLYNKNIMELYDHIVIVHENAFDGADNHNYNCNRCNIHFDSEDAYYIHIDNVHDGNSDSEAAAPVVKKISGHMIKKEDVADEVIEENVEGDDEEVEEIDNDESSDKPIKKDTIPVTINGKFICTHCPNKYSSAHYLGEHFMLSHYSYSDRLKLDDKKSYTSFPGYFLLDLIGMIKQHNLDEMKEILLTDCPICCNEYTIDNDLKKLYDAETKSTDIDFDTFRTTKNLAGEPIEVTCCNKQICKPCFENHVKYTNNIICPFCKYDHNKYDKKFISYTVANKFNKAAWREWWSNHLDILERDIFPNVTFDLDIDDVKK